MIARWFVLCLGTQVTAMFLGCTGVPVKYTEHRSSSNSLSAAAQATPSSHVTRPVPPVPVLGSYLAGVFFEKDGTPVAKARLTVGRSNFETETSANGEFAIPVTQIVSRKVELEIQQPLNTIRAELELPEEFVKPVNQARIDAGVTPLEGEEHLTRSGKKLDEQSSAPVINRKLGVQLPENRLTPEAFANKQTRQLLIVSSLPDSVIDQAQNRRASFWTVVDNESTNEALRFSWGPTPSGAAVVRIVFSQSRIQLSEWNGLSATIPALNQTSTGTYVLSSSSACTDPDFKPPIEGSLTTLSSGRCGVLRSQLPFAQADEYYVRLAAESDTDVRLSPVFRVSKNNTSPKLSGPVQPIPLKAGQPSALFGISLLDTETPSLSCPAALTVRSSDINLLPNKNIAISGIAPQCQISMSPVAGLTGTAALTIIGSDHELSQRFEFFVNISSPSVAGSNILPTSPAGTYYVNDDSSSGDRFTTAIGSDTNPGTASAPFRSIQKALSVAPASSIILVDAGRYAGPVVVSSVSVFGPNFDISPVTGNRRPEARIDPTGIVPSNTNLNNHVSVFGTNPVFRGFEVTAPAGSAAAIMGGSFSGHGCGENIVVSHNYIHDVVGAGIAFQSCSLSGLQITENKIVNTTVFSAFGGEYGQGIAAHGNSSSSQLQMNSLISNNFISGSGSEGISVHCHNGQQIRSNIVINAASSGVSLKTSWSPQTESRGCSVSKNIVSKSNKTAQSEAGGIQLGCNNCTYWDDIRVDGNIVTDSGNALVILSGSGDLTNKKLTVTANRFLAFGTQSIVHNAGGVLNAENNWFGGLCDLTIFHSPNGSIRFAPCLSR